MREVLNRILGWAASEPMARHYSLWRKSERLRSVANLERLFFRVVAELDPKFFIEIGAKTAITSRRARSRAPYATIVAFEANPRNYEKFRHHPRLAEMRVDYRNVALSDCDGSARFNIVMANGQLVNGRGSLLDRHSGPRTAEQVEVPCSRFDSLFDLAYEDDACLWIDVEGANAQVLQGGGQSLARAAAVFIEVEHREKWHGQWLNDEVTRHFAKAGLVPVARDFQSAHQNNVLFVRQVLLENPMVQMALRRYEREAAEGFKGPKLQA